MTKQPRSLPEILPSCRWRCPCTILAVIVVWVVLRASPWLATKMSPASIQLITQLTGIIVLGIGVLMGSAGLVEVLPGLG
jgi:small neutral amino acid transporter SnatA (MarC family)